MIHKRAIKGNEGLKEKGLNDEYVLREDAVKIVQKIKSRGKKVVYDRSEVNNRGDILLKSTILCKTKTNSQRPDTRVSVH